MLIHNGIEGLSRMTNSVVTMGTFDGVHQAHKVILNALVKSAYDLNASSVVITFWPHPKLVLSPDKSSVKLLSTLDEKLTLLESCGIDHLIIIPFTKDFSEIAAEDFVNNILVHKVGTKRLILGYDHHFGKNRRGNLNFLEMNKAEFGFEVQEIEKQLIEDSAISSTNIRMSLSAGDIVTASNLLGREYSISGKSR